MLSRGPRGTDLWPFACAACSACWDLPLPTLAPNPQGWHTKNRHKSKNYSSAPPLWCMSQIRCSGMRGAGDGRYLPGQHVGWRGRGVSGVTAVSRWLLTPSSQALSSVQMCLDAKLLLAPVSLTMAPAWIYNINNRLKYSQNRRCWRTTVPTEEQSTIRPVDCWLMFLSIWATLPNMVLHYSPLCQRVRGGHRSDPEGLSVGFLQHEIMKK